MQADAADPSVQGGGAAAPPAIELRGVNKSFGPVRANSDITLDVAAGTIHGIIGENGAGKSTLMSILYGYYQADSGDIRVFGKPLRLRSTSDAIGAGIGMVFQHFMLVDPFTVLENVVLGAEGGALLGPGLAAARRELQRLEADFGLDVDLDAVVGELPVGVQQRVEILKALYRGARVLILDEPTGVLTPQETERLFRVFRTLRDQGVTIVLITHKLREIMAVTEAVSVMRQGKMVAHLKTAETSTEALAELMVGRKVLMRVAKQARKPGKQMLAVEDLSLVDERGVTRVDGVSFSVCAGEIVGIAGVAGNGQSELLAALAGILPFQGGRIAVGSREATPGHPLDAHEMRDSGLAHVPEDRLRMGLVASFKASESAILGYHDDPAYNGPILTNRAEIVADCRKKMSAYDVRPQDPSLLTGNFSGGNQQKIVLAREMERHPELLLVGQPTRGVDIGAIEFIHKSLIAMRDAGCAVLLVSVELDEILSLSDRILVMFEGRFVGEVAGAAATERALGLMMANVVPEDAALDTAVGTGVRAPR